MAPAVKVCLEKYAQDKPDPEECTIKSAKGDSLYVQYTAYIDENSEGKWVGQGTKKTELRWLPSRAYGM